MQELYRAHVHVSISIAQAWVHHRRLVGQGLGAQPLPSSSSSNFAKPLQIAVCRRGGSVCKHPLIQSAQGAGQGAEHPFSRSAECAGLGAGAFVGV